ncbi:uncharacterized protein LOC125146808 [Prionailurus viverrinus]|uniref:uncharacterized protein LOC125146808 n=1 Tax=Prionailurus viverrinus TaxID=61388 RepID=UPI001FF38EE2|nr:uncharacterized protein LOC125146808 [Prionailurus viverrinus]XP_047679622.1 uncharacterized protein LOC125146808 [Prionailurus viverrinus]
MGCSPRPSSSPRPFSVSVSASPAAPRDVSPTPGDLLGASFSIICSVLRRELLRDVVGRCRYGVNNHLDHKYKPRPVNVIIYSAKKKIGEEMEYRLLGRSEIRCAPQQAGGTYPDWRRGVPGTRHSRHGWLLACEDMIPKAMTARRSPKSFSCRDQWRHPMAPLSTGPSTSSNLSFCLSLSLSHWLKDGLIVPRPTNEANISSRRTSTMFLQTSEPGRKEGALLRHLLGSPRNF